MVAELDGIAGREEHLVHVHELGRSQSAVGAILLQEDKKETSYQEIKVSEFVYFYLVDRENRNTHVLHVRGWVFADVYGEPLPSTKHCMWAERGRYAIV